LFYEIYGWNCFVGSCWESLKKGFQLRLLEMHFFGHCMNKLWTFKVLKIGVSTQNWPWALMNKIYRGLLCERSQWGHLGVVALFSSYSWKIMQFFFKKSFWNSTIQMCIRLLWECVENFNPIDRIDCKIIVLEVGRRVFFGTLCNSVRKLCLLLEWDFCTWQSFFNHCILCYVGYIHAECQK